MEKTLNGGFLILTGSIILDLGHGSMEEGKIIGPGALIGEMALLTPTTQLGDRDRA